MKKSLYLAAATAALLLSSAAAAQAQEFQPDKAGTWLIDVRGTGVVPSSTSSINTAAGAATGLRANVSTDYMPTLGITYFVTPNVSAELILGTTQHDIRAEGGGVDILARKTWVLPPVLTLQYRPLPAARFSPYVGAGVNYMLFYGGSNQNGLTVKTPSGFGWALQGGLDYAVQGPWTLNADVKKVFFSTNAEINGGALTSHVQLDPWVLSLGVGRKF